MEDKTNYGQSLMHMIKGNLGTGILAMPASFAHAGLINASIGMPLLCIICTYCVHLLVNSSRHLEGKIKGASFKYSSLAKCSFQNGPTWMRSSSELMCRLVDGILLVAQIGVCCVYLVFVTDNIVSILSTYRIYVTKNTIFMVIYPIALFLSYIRTLSRLAIASAAANLLQAVGISIILHYLAHDLDKIDLSKREKFQPIESVALGFGSAMFAFEGISVVLPVYSRMKQPLRMSGCSGIINVSYLVLLILNFVMGLFGFLRFGHNARDSITLNLPPEPLYDAVRAIFLVSVFLTYPLQFYVPNEIIWNWAKKSILMEPEIDLTVVRAIREVALPSISVAASHKQQQQQQQQQSISCTNGGQTSQLDTTYSALPAPPVSEIKEFQAANGRAAPPAKIIRNHSQRVQMEHKKWSTRSLVRYEYLCRTALVTLTFMLAVSVPKLNLLMDLIGSITGTTLSLILPAMIHTAAFWDDSRGLNRFTNVLINLLIIVFGLVAGACGTISSLISIMNSFAL